MGVYQPFKSGETGCMVYINEYGDAKPLYLKDLQDHQTGKIPPRGVNINSEKIQAIFDNIMHYVTEEDYAAAKEIFADPSWDKKHSLYEPTASLFAAKLTNYHFDKNPLTMKDLVTSIKKNLKR